MRKHLLFLMLSAIMIFAFTGCSKNVGSTTDGTGSGQLAAGTDGPRSGPAGPLPPGGKGLGPGGTAPGPLTGFSKKPTEESVGGSAPLMLSKADPLTSERQAMQSRDARQTREDSRRILVDIYFPFDRWGISEEGKKHLLESAGFLREHPQTKILIEGHCDERGSREYNLALGEKRARETRQFLADLGIHNPVAVKSYGKERPACREHDESCYWKNRRAHLMVEAE